MSRILLISHYFPPDGGAGTQRAAGIARHIGQFGWGGTVLTRSAPSQRGRWDPRDGSLELSDDGTLRIARIAQPTGGGRGAFCDLSLPYVHGYTERALAEAAGHDVAVITMSPFGLARVGQAILRSTRLPVVYDLRDPWALDGWREYQSWLHWRVDLSAMHDALRSAKGVIANTPAAREAILRKFPGLDPQRIVAIPNGYEDDVLSVRQTAGLPESEGFTIVHLGTFHGDWIGEHDGSLLGRLKAVLRYRPERIDGSGRTPLYLIRAVEALRASGDPLGARVRLVFAGVTDDHVKRLVRESSIASQVQLYDYLPHTEAIAWLARADALFLPLGCLAPSGRSLIVPGKCYEYLASGKPIIAAVPDGDAARMVREHAAGVVVDPCSTIQIHEAISLIARAGRTLRSLDGLEIYHRRNLTRQLVEFLTGLLPA